MKKFLFPFALLVFVNLVWQLMIWAPAYFPSNGGLLVWFAVSIAISVVFFLFFETILKDKKSFSFLGVGIILLIFAGIANFFTDISNYAKSVFGNAPIFNGKVSEISEKPFIFYTIGDFSLKSINDGEIGVSYHKSSRKNETYYGKYFAVPVFEKQNPNQPKLWLCDSYAFGRAKPDLEDFSLAKFNETELSKNIENTMINGKKTDIEGCRNAVGHYLKKKNLNAVENPLIIESSNESPETVFQNGKSQFRIFTVILNILFFTIAGLLFVKSLKKPKYEH